jgi:hypothetical protein
MAIPQSGEIAPEPVDATGPGSIPTSGGDAADSNTWGEDAADEEALGGEDWLEEDEE